MIPSPQNNGAVEVAAPTAPHSAANYFSTYQADVRTSIAHAVDLTNFPTELKAWRNWCNWRYEIREDGKPTKGVPGFTSTATRIPVGSGALRI